MPSLLQTDRSDADNVAILFTSGQSSQYRQQTITIAETLQQRATIYAIALEQDRVEDWIPDAVSYPHRLDENYFRAYRRELHLTLEPLLRQICQRAELHCGYTAEVSTCLLNSLQI